MSDDQPYLAACTMYRNAAEYLGEWIELHLMAGVERVFLYDNGSTDEHLDVLAPYIDDGIAVLHDWPVPFVGERGREGALVRSLDDCVQKHAAHARWIAFLDIDEFLFSPTGDSVADVLSGYEEHPAVCVSRAEFGTSGHATRPPGLVIENYVHRRPVRPDDMALVKSIVDPRRAVLALSPHMFLFREGAPVDEDMRPLDRFDRSGSKPVAWSKLRIHHYGSKSEEEAASKSELWRTAGSTRAGPLVSEAGWLGVVDRTLADRGPAVRAALERRYACP